MQMTGRKDKLRDDRQVLGPRKSDLGGPKTSAEKVQGDWRKLLRAWLAGDR